MAERESPNVVGEAERDPANDPPNDPPNVVEEQFQDEGYAESSNTSYVSSIASDIRKGIEENGRTYPAYGKNTYGIPVDEAEQDRNDMQHCKFNLLLDGKFHNAPIIENPGRILDLGTGSGIWAIDMADKYPSAEVLGIDIAPTQPSWVPPNCQFEIEDMESDWLFPQNAYDLIHARDLLFAIRDWPKLIQQAYSCVKPGGYLEFNSTWPRASSDDNSLPSNSAYVEFLDTLAEIGEAIGASVDVAVSWKSQMEAAGFTDVTENIVPVPSSPWPKDPHLKRIGAFELENFSKGAEGWLIRGFTSVLERPIEEAQILAARAKQECRNPKMHSYIKFYSVFGRKPETST